MIGSNWQSGITRECKLTITDIHRLKDLKSLIEASEKKLAMLQQDPECNSEEIDLETTIVKASKQSEDNLNEFVLFEIKQENQHRKKPCQTVC